jgi:hypothetical protein
MRPCDSHQNSAAAWPHHVLTCTHQPGDLATGAEGVNVLGALSDIAATITLLARFLEQAGSRSYGYDQ